MANSSESVGQLLANSALMKGERDLFRKQDAPPAEAAKTATQPTAEPIVHDSKAVAAVLLAMLDEQLQAADAALAAGSKAIQSNTAEADASKRVAQKYASDGLVGDDLGTPQQFAQPDAARISNTPPIASADLQTFIQRFAAFAAGQPAAFEADGPTAKRLASRNDASFFSTPSLLRFAGIAAGVLWLAMMIVGWIAH